MCKFSCNGVARQVARNIAQCDIPCNGRKRCETSFRSRFGMLNTVLLSHEPVANGKRLSVQFFQQLVSHCVARQVARSTSLYSVIAREECHQRPGKIIQTDNCIENTELPQKRLGAFFGKLQHFLLNGTLFCSKMEVECVKMEKKKLNLKDAWDSMM